MVKEVSVRMKRNRTQKREQSANHEAQERKEAELEVERMVNEGLGGGLVTLDNGWVGESDDAMDVLAMDDQSS